MINDPKKNNSKLKFDGFSSVHTELLAMALVLVMQKWVENFAKEWVEYPFLATPTNVNSIANVQCERTLKLNSV